MLWMLATAWAADPPTHCTQDEKVLFTCQTGAKVLSLCGGDGWLQYRYGPAEAPELVFPAERGLKAFHRSEQSSMHSSLQQVWFEREGHRYTVQVEEPHGGHELAPKPWSGVEVKQGDKTVAKIACTSHATFDAELWKTVPEEQ